jgi:malate permease and related proteins
MSLLEQILTAVIPVLAAVAIGFAWVRSGQPFESAALVAIVADLGTPCLVFANLARASIPREDFTIMALATGAMLLGFALLGSGLLAGLRLPQRTFLPAIVFANTGNLGLPMALNAFGQRGLSYAIVIFTVIAIANFTVGQALAAGIANWRGLLRMPLIYAALAGTLVAYFAIPLPRWLVDTVALIGGMSVPLMLLMLGASLARLKVAAARRAGLVSALRFGVGITVGSLVCLLFGLTGLARSSLLLQCAMPVAVNNYLFALRWNNDPEDVAGTVVVSTLASVVTVPALLWFLL